jgi:hypothetical protein
MKKILMILGYILVHGFVFGQGYNHQWLLGSWDFFQDPKGRILFDSSSYSLINENRWMVFEGTEGNISDANGNFLMSSNGVWIANAINDTMMNGDSINPNGITSNWPDGLPMEQNNVFLPFPGDSTKYLLIHHTATDNGTHLPVYEIYYSIIDITHDSGLGEVISKNNIALLDTLNWGIGVCKHANGRDWWIVVLKDSSNLAFTILFDINGVNQINQQSLNYFPLGLATSSQLTFSPDGTKFIASTYDNPMSRNSFIIISDFNRCTGMFSNTQTLQLTSGSYLWGLAFSPSGKYAYACSSNYIFQVDVNTLAVDTVATYDGFISPVGSPCCATTFWNMYLAANGKIYITSGSGVEHLHEMNYPDSAGIACDVQQHAISLGYAQLRAVPNHPNYYLGCDTTSSCPCLITGINNLSQTEFRFRIFPNPILDNFLNIGYLLPQNKCGLFQIYNVTGEEVFKYTLPPWSNEQRFRLPNLSDGIYNCTITSGTHRESKKIAVIVE